MKFRDKDEEDENDQGLRLYCIHVSEQMVILINGGRKTNQDPTKCENCERHFKFANATADAFFHAKNVSKKIEINGMDIDYEEEDFYLNI